MSQLKRVFIYNDLPSPSLSTAEVADFLSSLGITAECRGNFFRFLDLDAEGLRSLSGRLASALVADIESPLDELSEPGAAEVGREASFISGNAHSYGRELYEGNWLQRILYSRLLGRDPDGPAEGTVHIIFTGRLFVTFEGRRYHARVILSGCPSLISTSGLVEAPARPRRFYFAKAALARAGRDPAELDKMFRGTYIVYDDPLITPALKSYALQAIFYQIGGQEFCRDPSCCLYNSHWQEEVLRVQVRGGLCGRCRGKLEEMLRG